MKKLYVLGLAILGVAFLVLAVYYWVTPAGSLPQFMPGYEAGATQGHLKHGLAAALLGLGCGVLAWFLSGNKSSSEPRNTPTE